MSAYYKVTITPQGTITLQDGEWVPQFCSLHGYFSNLLPDGVAHNYEAFIFPAFDKLFSLWMAMSNSCYPSRCTPDQRYHMKSSVDLLLDLLKKSSKIKTIFLQYLSDNLFTWRVSPFFSHEKVVSFLMFSLYRNYKNGGYLSGALVECLKHDSPESGYIENAIYYYNTQENANWIRQILYPADINDFWRFLIDNGIIVKIDA